MVSVKDLLKLTTNKEMYDVLEFLTLEDCYFEYFTSNVHTDNFLYMLEAYDLAFVASDNRVLLTQTGEKLLNQLHQMLI